MLLVLRLVITAALFVAVGFAADLKSVEAEKNPERRSELAMVNASTVLDDAKRAYSEGKPEEFQADLKELQESVALAYDSLTAAGKSLSRNTRRGKKAELQSRLLLRKLDDFEKTVAADDREHVEAVRKEVSEFHDKFLFGIMEKRQ
jgi:hypothetical protein